MGTAKGMIAAMRGWLGTTEHPAGSNHNEITVRYNREVSAIGDGPWCAMTVTIAGIDSNNTKAVGQYAYTVYHADWFARRGQWHTGTAGIRAGDVVFFDWSGTHSRSRIDHVGVVEKVSGTKIYTIEGNHNDRCVRVVRDGAYIAGYGRPGYSSSEGLDMDAKDVSAAVWDRDELPAPVGPDGKPLYPDNTVWKARSYLRDTNEHVRALEAALAAQGVKLDAILAKLDAGGS